MKKLFITCVLFMFFFLNLGASIDLMDGLLAYYPFNNEAVDESGNGHDGSAFGDVTFDGELIGPAAVFSTNGYISIPYDPVFNTEEFTISAWINTSGSTSNQCVVAHGEHRTSDKLHYGLYLSTNEYMYVNMEDYSDENYNAISETLYELDTSYFIVGSRDINGNLKIYINGVLEDTLESTPPPALIEEILTIGVALNAPNSKRFYFNGIIDEVRIYNRVLSEEEIQILHSGIEANAEINPETLNLKSKGKWVTVYVELPAGFDVDNIDFYTVKLHYKEGYLLPKWGDIRGTTYLFKFDRSQVKEMLSGVSGDVELKVTGKVGSIDFNGVDTIRVINRTHSIN